MRFNAQAPGKLPFSTIWSPYPGVHLPGYDRDTTTISFLMAEKYQIFLFVCGGQNV